MTPHDRYVFSLSAPHIFSRARLRRAAHTTTRATRASTPGVSMGGHPAGITVDAVREQLAALGHDDVSDDVIASFLDSLHRHANVAPPPVETCVTCRGVRESACVWVG